MMRLLNNKKNVKTVSIIVGVLFVISVGALAYTQMAGHGGSSAISNIGVIDMQRIVESNPMKNYKKSSMKNLLIWMKQVRQNYLMSFVKKCKKNNKQFKKI